MTTQEIIGTLIEEKGYDRTQTERLAPKIDALPEDIRTSLEGWITTGEFSSPAYSGFDVKKIKEMQPAYKEVAAYLALDWIRRDSKAAIAQLKRPYISYIPRREK